jgi:hypothetical protein
LYPPTGEDGSDDARGRPDRLSGAELVRMTAALVEAAEALKKAAAAMPALASSPPNLRLSDGDDLAEWTRRRSRRSLVLTALVAGALGAAGVWLLRAPREVRPAAPRARVEAARPPVRPTVIPVPARTPLAAPSPVPLAAPSPVPIAAPAAAARPTPVPAPPAVGAASGAEATRRPAARPAVRRAVRKKSSIHDEDGVLEPSFL